MYYTLGFAFNSKEKDMLVLLIRKLKPKWQEGKLNGVGGKIEQGETPIAAMVREFKEETNIQTSEKDWTKRGIMEGHRANGEYWCVYIFAADLGDTVQLWMPSPTPELLITIKVIDIWKNDNIIFNLKWMIPLVMDAEIQPFTITNCERSDIDGVK